MMLMNVMLINKNKIVTDFNKFCKQVYYYGTFNNYYVTLKVAISDPFTLYQAL